jgi:hypothetical protein
MKAIVTPARTVSFASFAKSTGRPLYAAGPSPCVAISFASSPPSESAAAPSPMSAAESAAAPSPMFAAGAAPSPMSAAATPSPMAPPLDRRDVVSRGCKVADNRTVDWCG